MLHSTSTSVGSLTLYRTTLQTVFVTAEALVHTLRMAFQGIFLMGAFCAATSLKPRLEPDANRLLPYRPSSRGMSIEVRCASDNLVAEPTLWLNCGRLETCATPIQAANSRRFAT